MQASFKLTKQDDIGILTMDVPGESMNTLKAEFAEEIAAVLTDIENDSSLQGLVIASGKANSFIAGADISMLDACETTEQAKALAVSGQQIFARLQALNMPVVAAIHGPCLGGGLELALACHYRVCSDSDKTRLGLPEVQLGLLPGSGGTQRLPALVGLTKALDWILTGKQVRAKQALKAGLVDDMVPQSILLSTAIKLASVATKKKSKLNKTLLNRLLEDTSIGRDIVFSQATKKALAKSRGNYPAVEKILSAIKAGYNGKTGYEVEASLFSELVKTPESEALRGIFLATNDMKKQDFGAEPDPVNKAMVLGGGLMGGGIAYVIADRAKAKVRIKDIAEQGVNNAFKYGYDLLMAKRKRRFISQAQLNQTMSRYSGALDYKGAEATDIVIEAVFEDLALKHQMVQDVEKNCSEHTIFATNTSSLPITDIAEAAERPERVIGLHYFSPVDKMPLAEVIVHPKTSAKTLATTVAFARKQGKTPIVVKDGAGFYVNRILAPYMNEAARILLEGEGIDKIDKALLDYGFPVGPIKLLDEVGLDVASKISPILEQKLGERFKAPDAFARLLADKRLGKKNGKGFYLYSGKSKGKQVDNSVYSVLGVSMEPNLPDDEIAQRCVLLMVNEALRCLDEGLLACPRDGDIGAIFGIGFPPFLGGPFKLVDKLGPQVLLDKLNSYHDKYGERFAPCEMLKRLAEENQHCYPKPT